ncbi:hypothetical protein TrLO_g16010 [Triparma laevis f. longispina]|uniref:Tetratricopeptide repeat protein n=1 Tax=Triparma laevis f. longispina TaxID=1714387 RepID=A0A9W7A7Y8_9STRA|nr:hypothetical protein TrLO_g16010 [Triparma laevis f. longispina]
MICKECTRELMNRSEPCLICRKSIVGFDVGVFSVGARGLWPTPYKNLRQLASGEGFNEYFRTMFNGNEATFLKWKEEFDVLEIVGGRGCHRTVRESLRQQVLAITRSEDLEKLRALANLCSLRFLDDMSSDPSLLVVAWRRILKVLELTMPEAKKARNKVGDYDDSERYYERAREGYEEQFGRDSEEALDVVFDLVIRTKTMGDDERNEKLRDLLKRMERALGEEHLTTLDALWQLGAGLTLNDEYEEAKEVHERYLADR